MLYERIVANCEFRYDSESGQIWRKHRGQWKETAFGAKASGHRFLRLGSKVVYAHRLIWFIVNGVWPDGVIDHKNQDASCNKLNNLRDVTLSENARNRAIASNNKSGITGINYRADQALWTASIYVEGKRKHLGSFKTQEQAIVARKTAEKRYYSS